VNIYVASSWKNPWQPDVVRRLRRLGHDVYDFKQPTEGESGFTWKEVDDGHLTWSPDAYRKALEHPLAVAAYNSDMNALQACDACVLVLPCGSSAHLELGVAFGMKKRTAVLFPYGMSDLDGVKMGHSMTLMVKCADKILTHIAELEEWVA
jgi:hypothetical protein